MGAGFCSVGLDLMTRYVFEDAGIGSFVSRIEPVIPDLSIASFVFTIGLHFLFKC